MDLLHARTFAGFKTKLNAYGLPLDNRALYTKTDWEVWTATLAEKRADFDALMQPVYRFVAEPSAMEVSVEQMLDDESFALESVEAYRERLTSPQTGAAWKRWPCLSKQLGVELTEGLDTIK